MKRKVKYILLILAVALSMAFVCFGAGCSVTTKLDQWTCDHVYNNGVVVRQSTCSEYGEKKYTCYNCGKEKTGQIPLINHSYNSGVTTTEPTCTETGIVTYTCVDCGHEKTAVAAMIAHDVITVAAVPATCETVGYCEWEYCDVCGFINVPRVTLPATGHVEVMDSAVAATCTTAGKTAGSHCSVCDKVLVAQTDVQAFGHTVVTVEGKTPTCSEAGLTAGSSCSVCGIVLTAQTEIPATGNCVDSDNDSYCDTCGKIDFSYYQDSANYTTEAYVTESSLAGKVARLHVATTDDEGAVTYNRFDWITTGVVTFRYNRESDVFEYQWTNFSGQDNYLDNTFESGFGEPISHVDVQYYAFEVDGEYYVDIYFDSDVTLTLCAGASVTSSTLDQFPVVLGDINFIGGVDNVVVLVK